MQRINGVAGRRLALNKQTLRTLGDAELRDAAGGNPTAVTVSTIPCTLVATATCVTLTIVVTGTFGGTATPGPNTETNTTVHTQPADPQP